MDDFLLICLGGASVRRLGASGLGALLCAYVCVFCFFFLPAMSAHTGVDSGAERSLCRGGHEVREGGGEGR